MRSDALTSPRPLPERGIQQQAPQGRTLDSDDAAFSALVESILADEAQLLHDDTDRLLTGYTVTIQRDHGVVWTSTALAKFDERRRRQQRHLAVSHAGVRVEGTDTSDVGSLYRQCDCGRPAMTAPTDTGATGKATQGVLGAQPRAA